MIFVLSAAAIVYLIKKIDFDNCLRQDELHDEYFVKGKHRTIIEPEGEKGFSVHLFHEFSSDERLYWK
jgi:hypothetical protein